MNSLDIQKWRNKYIYQINESEDDDFNITTDAFDVAELKKGDIIYSGYVERPRMESFYKNGKG
jgi:hypothetical protein